MGAGSRDTEVAVAAKQRAHDEDHRGEVHTFRMALFAAHLGGHHDAFLEPSSEECVSRVREVSEAFQQVYLEEEPPEQPVNVHLLPYPIQVESDGAVNALPGWENFPDTQVPLSLSSSGEHCGWYFVSNQLLAISASILSHPQPPPQALPPPHLKVRS